MTETRIDQWENVRESLLWLYEAQSGKFLNSWISNLQTLLTALLYTCLFGLWNRPFNWSLEEIYATCKSFFYGSEGLQRTWQYSGGDDDFVLFSICTPQEKNTAIVIDPQSNTTSTPKETRSEYLIPKETTSLPLGKYYEFGRQTRKLDYMLFYMHILDWPG